MITMKKEITIMLENSIMNIVHPLKQEETILIKGTLMIDHLTTKTIEQ